MSGGRRFFVLSDPLPQSQIPHLLGRVVEDKVQPHRSFAPINTNPDELVSGILPEPVAWPSRKDFYSNTSGWSFGGGLADLVTVDQAFGSENGVALEGDEVKCYNMANTMHQFQRLMGHGAYSRDVRDLLGRAKSGHAYFVTGFLTARDGVLSHYSSRLRSSSVELTAPVTSIMGVAIPMPGNPQVSPSIQSEQRQETSVNIVDEVIIAASYDIIRTTKSLDLATRGLVKRSIINAGPKRTKPKHMAFGSLEPFPLNADTDTDDWSWEGDSGMGFEKPMESDTAFAGRWMAGPEALEQHESPEPEEEILFVNTETHWDDSWVNEGGDAVHFQVKPIT